MKMRPLGQSGIQASVVAVGTWQFGGWMWGGNPEDDSVAAIHAAQDAGINLIDTAPIYGFGVSEQIVGKAIKDRRDKFVIASKCGMVANVPDGKGEDKFRSSAAGADPDGLIPIKIYNGPDSIREEVEMSLKRLGTDHIDLYQTHWQESTTPIADTMACLLKLKEQGKIRAIGCCNANTDQLREYLDAGQLDSDQEQFSMLDKHTEGENLDLAQKENFAVLAYSPLGRGLLTGKIDADYEFDDGDHRANMKLFSQDNRKKIQEMLGKIKPIADDKGITLTQLTIAWTVHQPGVTHALCGSRNAEHVKANAKAGTVDLTDEENKTINDAIDAYHAVGVSAG